MHRGGRGARDTADEPTSWLGDSRGTLLDCPRLYLWYWQPKIAAELNDNYVKLVKVKGEFVWHQHEHEDELFLVIKGRLCIKLRDRDLWLNEGELAVVPRGVEHRPVAEEEAHVLLLEPKTTVNTGEVQNERTVESPDWV